MKKNFNIIAISLLISILVVSCSGPTEKATETSALPNTANKDVQLPFGFTPKEFYNNFTTIEGVSAGELKKITDTGSGFSAQSAENEEVIILLNSNLDGYTTSISLPFRDIAIDSFISLAKAVIKVTDATIDYDYLNETLKLNDPPKTIDDYRFCNSHGISFSLSSTGFRLERDDESSGSYSYFAAVAETTTNKTEAAAESSEPLTESEVDSVPTEYKSALKKAESYSSTMRMSKAGIYDQLTSEYGEKFSPEAAQYAIDNMTADWNANALEKAKSYSETMHMSKAGIYDQLISEHGEKFTEEEAQYAVDNVVADWKANALEKAKSYQDTMSMSPEAIRGQLVSDYGEKFTQEEADYAVENLE